MGLETGSYISALVSTNPLAADPKSQGDDHIRFLKAKILETWPNVSGAVTPTHTELNYVDGVTSAIQDQLNLKAPKDTATFTGNTTLPSSTIIGAVTASEINYLSGVTSAIQTQINAKGAITGQTWTGTHDYTGATLQAATQTAGDASTKVATTSFVSATAFSAALPSQTGNSGKFVTTDGSNASWALPIADQTSHSGKFLTTNGTTTSWAAVTTPGLVFISTATASAVATVDITGLDSTYSAYLLVATNVVPATGASRMWLRTSTDGGSSFASGAAYKHISQSHDTTGTAHTSSTTATSIVISDEQITSSPGISFQLFINKPSTASVNMNWTGTGQNNSGLLFVCFGSGNNGLGSDVDAIRLMFSAGNITSGEFKLYGLRAS